MAVISMTKMWDPKTSTFSSVNPNEVESYKSRGLTTSLPSDDTLNKLRSSAKSGRQSSYSPITGISQEVNPFQSQLEGLRDAQLAQTRAALNRQRQASLSNLSAERATIKPEYQRQKIQAGVTAKQGQRSFDEYMAQRGGNQSGIAGQGTLLNNMAYQGQKGSLDQAEAAAISDNARRVSDVGNAYENDLSAAEAGIQAQYLQNYIQQMNQDRAYQQAQDQFAANLGLQQAGLTGTYNGQQTMAARSAEQDQAYRQATLKLQQDSQLWQQQFQERGATAEEAYRMAQLKFQQEQAKLDNEYRYASLARSSGGGSSRNKGADGGKYSDSATASMLNQIKAGLSDGYTVEDMLDDLNSLEQDGTAKLRNFDVEYLRDWLKSQMSMNNLRRMLGGEI